MDSTLACIAAWMPRQRWYAAKGHLPRLRLVAWWDLPADDCRVRTYLVADECTSPTVVYQIPVVSRATATVDIATDHIIGNPEPGMTFIDGVFDPAYADALLRLIATGDEVRGPHAIAQGRPIAALALDVRRTARVLAGEQSNTSMIFTAHRPHNAAVDTAAAPIICKIFRQLHGGLNPDIELTTALWASGSRHVPSAIGSVKGTWPDPATNHRTLTGSLAVAQEFLPDVEDAWRVALKAAATGDDFSERARTLGAATAEIHVALASLFPTHETRPADRDAQFKTWHHRLTTAMAEVPAIAERKEEIEAAFRRALESDWPRQQRIHGDYHLGQVLRHPERGWVVLDFEGEPLRPMRERIRPDLALRDVAGMLRSFDYVAGSICLDHPDRPQEAIREWVRDARQGFIDGYAAESGLDLDTHATLLTAFEVDKAVYEAIYESRNRPAWVTIPMSAIASLVERPATVA